MLNVIKYVIYNKWLPKQALLAVRILSHVTRQPGVHALLLSEFTRAKELANEIRHEFVECLESDLPIFTDTDSDCAVKSGDQIKLTINEKIIKLLEECLSNSKSITKLSNNPTLRNQNVKKYLKSNHDDNNTKFLICKAQPSNQQSAIANDTLNEVTTVVSC